LVLIVTTRSEKKSRETIETVRAHVLKVASTAACVGSRGGPDYTPQSVISRIHLLAIELDLCKLSSVYAAADRLLHGQLRDPTGVVAGGRDVALPRLDVTIFNAGVGGWDGVYWPKVLPQLLTVGIKHSFTYPAFKNAPPSVILPPQEIMKPADSVDGKQPQLAEVFCANLFGHYILAHELLPFMTKEAEDRNGPATDPARIIWTSSIDAESSHLNFDDFQAVLSKAPYESSKRITDLMVLSSNISGKGPKMSGTYFDLPASSSSDDSMVKPKLYLSHPGVVVSTLFPLNAFLFFWYTVAMYLARLFGSPWHTIDAYLGAIASVHLALAPAETLEAQNALHAKMGSASDWRGRQAYVKKTEVEGWGWGGVIEDPEELQREKQRSGILAKLHGRKWDSTHVTEAKMEQFEEDARECWTELELLRKEWESIMGRGDSGETSSPGRNGTLRAGLRPRAANGLVKH
jgi:3-keto steroid reductase